MKWSIVALACVMAALPLPADDYVPLTPDEAALYIQLDPDGAALDISTWDTVQHTTPVVILPDGLIVVARGEAVAQWRGPLVVDVASGSLLYHITIPELRVAIPPLPWWPYVACAGGGFVAGILLVLFAR